MFRGIWTRDIKTATNIPQMTLTKTLKILEQRSLIKSVRSVVSKSKKLYVLFDVVPAKSVTGGPWYSDQEFDHEFVSELSNFKEGINFPFALMAIAICIALGNTSFVDCALLT